MNTVIAILLLVVIVAIAAIKLGGGSTNQRRVKLAARDSATGSKPSSGPRFHWPSIGNFDFEVVGESHYQHSIASLAGNHGSESADVQCIAELTPEDQIHMTQRLSGSRFKAR